MKDLCPGMTASTYLVVHEMEMAKTRSGDDYLKLKLGDRSGIIEARVWEKSLAREMYDRVAPEEIVFVKGYVVEYNGLQLNVESFSKVDRSLIQIGDFRPSTEKDVGKMLVRFGELLASVKHRELSGLLKAVFEPSLLSEFSLAAAGRRVHHNYSGGLLEHTLEVLEYCLNVIQLQGRYINPDLLLAGAALHDIGKLWEYDQGGISFRLTEKGKLIGGHVILGRDFVCDAIEKIGGMDEELEIQLEHLILSHHGRREWGAVEEPKTVEAISLHYADLLSARINQAGLVLASGHGRERWTSVDRFLGKSLFRPKEAHTESSVQESFDDLMSEATQE